MHPEVERLCQLPIQEKLRVVEQLWDDIAESREPFPLPEWHREEAERRAADLRADPSMAISRQELRRDMEDAHG